MNQNDKLILELLMRILLEAIVERRENKEPLTYGCVHKRAKRYENEKGKNPKLNGHLIPIGQGEWLVKLNDAIREQCQAPPISAIVINAKSKAPGDGIEIFPGFEGYAGENLAEKRRMAKKGKDKVFKYPLSDWKKIYTGLFG